MKYRELLDAAFDELESVGIKPKIADHHGRHYHIIWHNQTGERRHVNVSASGDVRAMRNARASVRRILRHDGMLNSGDHR